MLFVGIDLAWSEKNWSGIAILEGAKNKATLKYATNVLSNDEIKEHIIKIKDQDALIAIDAPLIVPNQDGRRIAEKIVGDLFRKYNAGAHPANRKRLSQWSGNIRGEEISKILEQNNFIHNPYIEQFKKQRAFFEVYPHPSMVVLFKLQKVLPYKAKPKRDYPSRWKVFKQYQSYLKELSKSSPQLILPKEITEKKVEILRGQKLKEYEDLLDSIFCAYIAYYCWTHPDKTAVLGDMKRGYILTPIFDYMYDKLKSKNSQKTLTYYSKIKQNL